MHLLQFYKSQLDSWQNFRDESMSATFKGKWHNSGALILTESSEMRILDENQQAISLFISQVQITLEIVKH